MYRPEQVLGVLSIAGSCSLVSPFSYSTNLIVAETAGYTLKNFLVLGFPLLMLVVGWRGHCVRGRIGVGRWPRFRGLSLQRVHVQVIKLSLYILHIMYVLYTCEVAQVLDIHDIPVHHTKYIMYHIHVHMCTLCMYNILYCMWYTCTTNIILLCFETQVYIYDLDRRHIWSFY